MVNGRVEFINIGDVLGIVDFGVVEIVNLLCIDGNEIIINIGIILYFNYDNDGDVIMDINIFVLDVSVDRIGVGILILSIFFYVNYFLGIINGFFIFNVIDVDRWYFYIFFINDLYLYFNNIVFGIFDDVIGNYIIIFDRDLKFNILEIDIVIEKVKKLEVVDYIFKC